MPIRFFKNKGDRFEEEGPVDSSNSNSYLGSSNSIVLILCRAIAPYDDPPLGCAVLTLGFSMEKGRVLRIAQLRRQTHLPRERFIECLQKFSRCMGCIFEATISNEEKGSTSFGSSLSVLEAHHVQQLIQAHLPAPDDDTFEQKAPWENSTSAASSSTTFAHRVLLASPLQSVKSPRRR